MSGGKPLYSALPVKQAVAADHARVPDVDHVPVRHVQDDAKAEQEHEPEQQPVRAESQSDRRRSLRPERDPQHPRQQICEQRIRRRNRDVEVARAEERVRHREGKDDREIRVKQPERRSQERRDEQHAEPDPDPRRIDRAAELAWDAPGHDPTGLRAGPSLENPPAPIVDDRPARSPYSAYRPARAARRTRPASDGGRPGTRGCTRGGDLHERRARRVAMRRGRQRRAPPSSSRAEAHPPASAAPATRGPALRDWALAPGRCDERRDARERGDGDGDGERPFHVKRPGRRHRARAPAMNGHRFT